MKTFLFVIRGCADGKKNNIRRSVRGSAYRAVLLFRRSAASRRNLGSGADAGYSWEQLLPRADGKAGNTRDNLSGHGFCAAKLRGALPQNLRGAVFRRFKRTICFPRRFRYAYSEQNRDRGAAPRRAYREYSVRCFSRSYGQAG